MKVCAACCIELPREKFSNKQWNTKQHQRRCIECIDTKRECILLDKLHDEALFKQPPREEDCPICFLRLPSFGTGSIFRACCGKMICGGCINAVARMDKEEKCPFCRTPAPTSDEEIIKRVMKRVEVGDADAIHNLAYYYNKGNFGFSQDYAKALELYLRSGELGCAAAYNKVGYAYDYGKGVERDEKKASQYYELAAMRGDVCARHNLGIIEENKGDIDRALKHFMTAVEFGYSKSLVHIKGFFVTGLATKDDYAKALRAYQAYLDEIKSDQRDKAAAFSDIFKYY